ncbi:Fibulin-1 [Holothuria leucospilota]|uniref:Fibulin-1 n=1 Tax=Holothuria leucospilota TaxID=206669 RepID=A0A9Q1BDG2_HOLLE|nr:Fibulin-1 [Holothuria leucospilota]
MKVYIVLLLFFAVIRTILSQCSTATVRMQRSEQSAEEGDSTTISFVLDCLFTASDHTIGLTYSNKGTTDNNDYDTTTTTVNVPAGMMFFGTSLDLFEDTTVEGDEAFCITINSAGGGSGPEFLTTAATQLSTTVTILNDDTVLSYIDGTATSSDYTTVSTTVTLSGGSTRSIEVPITITGDTFIETDEMFTVSLGMASVPTSYVNNDAITIDATTASSVITIVDDDTLNVNFVSCGSHDEGTDNVQFIVSYTPSVTTTGYSFSYSIDTGGTTAESGDYSPYGDLSNSVINIQAGVPSQTFSLTYIDDMKVENDEEIVFILKSVGGPGATTVGPTATTTCSILDNDDAMLAIEVSNSIAEDGLTLTTMLSLSKQLEDTGYSATITLVDGTTDSNDYNIFSTSFEIPTSTSSFEYLLGITDDDDVENCESFTISLASVGAPTGFRIDALTIDTTQQESIATISVDETATVGIVDILTYTEGPTASFSVVLTSTGTYQDTGYSATIAILQGSTEGTGVGGDYSSSIESVLLPMNGDDATISIGLMNNLKFEDFETFTASLMGVSPPTGFKSEIIEIDATQNTKVGVIADDDSVSLTFQSSMATVGEGTTTTVTVSLDNPFEDGIFTLNLGYSGDLASTGTFVDYSGELTVDIPADTTEVSFTVTVSGDSWVEDTETVDISLSSVSFPAGYSRTAGTSFMTPSTFSLTVTDDDSATISLVSSSITFTEQDSTDSTVTVTFSIDNTILIPGYSVSLDWLAGTASEANNDYTSGDPSVSIPVQATMQTFEFVVQSNTIVEDHESLTVSLNSIITPTLIRSDNAVLIAPSPGDSSVITIEDDDTATLCFQDLASVTEGISYSYTFVTDLEIEDQFTVSVRFGPGSAKSYSNVDGTELVPINTNANMFSTSLSLTLVVDNLVEDFDTFNVTLDNVAKPSSYNRNAGEAVVIGSGTCSQVVTTIYDDDTAISYADRTTTSSDYSGTTTVMLLPTLMPQVGLLIPTDEDDIVEDNESFDVILMDVNANGMTMRTDVAIITTNTADQTTTITIMDDDSATLTVSSANECFDENNPNTVITLLLDKQLQDPGYTFDLIYGDLTAVGGTDYFTSNTQGDIATLTTTFTYSVTLSDDSIVEADQSFSLSLTAVNHPSGFVRTDAIFLHPSDRSSTVTIKEDDTATLSVSASKITVLEDDSSAEVVLCLSNTLEDQAGFSVTLSFDAKTAHDQTSTANIDYTASPTMLQLPQHPDDKLTVTVALSDDSVVEDLESFCLSMQSVTGPLTEHVTINTGQDTTTVCITDDDTATVSIIPPSLSHTEDDVDTTATVTLQWSAPFQDAGFTQVLSYMDGTAVSADYTPVSTTVTLPADPVTSIEVPITITGDTIIENDEIFTVSLGMASAPASYANTDGITIDATSFSSEVTIVNDDTLTVNFVSCGSQNEGADMVEFIVSYSPALTTTGYSFSFAIDNGMTSAESGDYTLYGDLASSPINIPTSETLQTFSMTYIDDTKVEDDEEIVIVLTSVDGAGATMVGATATVTCNIMDNDDATLCFEDLTSVTEGGSYHYTFSTDLEIEDQFTVSVSFVSGSAKSYSNVDGTVLVPLNSMLSTSLSLTLVEDTFVEDFETFSVTLDSIAGPAVYNRNPTDAVVFGTGTCSQVVTTIHDDDTATIAMSVPNSQLSEGDIETISVDIGGGQLCIESVSLTVSYFDRTTTSSDYTGTTTVIAIPTAVSQVNLNIPTDEDEIVEDNESFEVILLGVNTDASTMRSDAVFITTTTADQTTTVTIMDDDTATLSVTSTSECFTENDPTTEVTLLLDKQFQDSGFTFDLVYTDLTALSASDYSSMDTQGDIPTLAAILTYSITLSDDSIVEADQSFSVSLNSVNHPMGYARSDAIFLHPSDRTFTVTIKDDDTATLSVSTSKVTVLEGDSTAEVILCLSNTIEDSSGLTVDISYTSKTAFDESSPPVDYTASPTMLQLPQDPTDKLTVSVALNDDDVVEDLESFCLSMSSVTGPLTDHVTIATGQESATVCITDDDTATLALQVQSSVTEDATTVTATLVVTGDAIEDAGFTATLGYSGNAADPSDFASIETVPITSSTAATTFELVIQEDSVVEDHEQIIMELLSVQHPFTDRTAGAVIIHPTPASVTQTLTIMDEDTENNDYSTLTTSFGIDAMSLSTTITIDVTTDAILEDNEFFQISLVSTTNPVGYDAGRGPGVVLGSMSITTTAIINDDDTASCSFSPSTYCPAEGDSTLSITFTCDILIEDSGYSAKVDEQCLYDFNFTAFTYIDGDATVGNDFSVLTSSVGLLTTGNALSFAVSILDDMIVEDDQSFTIGVTDISEPIGFIRSGIITSDSSVTVTIKDDDSTTCSINNNPTVTESIDSFATIEVVCDKQLEESGFSIDLSVMDVTTEGANDYDVSVSSIDIPSLTETFSATLSITNNQDVEDKESFTVTLGNVNLPGGFKRSSAVITADVTGTVVINDDDTATCTLSLVSDCVTENTDVSICILCDKMFEDDGYEVSLAYSPDTAVYGNDYTSTVTMATYPSATTTLKIDLDVVDDMIVEDDQSFYIEFAGGNEPTGFFRNDAIEIVTSTSTVTIKDDDTHITYLAKSATEGNDYTASPTAVAIPVATTSFSFTVPIINDEIVEDCASFCLELIDVSQPSSFIRANSAVAISSTSTVSILDDDTALAYSPDTAVYGNDYTSTVTMATYPSATTTLKIDLDVVDDMIVEDDQSFYIEFAGANEPLSFCRNDAIEIVTSTSTVTIKDDDTLSCSLSTGVTTVTEGVGVTADVGVSCNLDVEAAGFSLDINYLAKSATEGNDFMASPTAVAIPVATTSFSFTVPIINDEIVEDCSSFCLELNDVSQPSSFIRANSAVAISSTSTVSILDDDTATCTLSLVSDCVAEDTDVSICILCDKMFEDDGFEMLVCFLNTGVTTAMEGVAATADIEVLCFAEVEAAGFSLDITYLAKSATEGNDFMASPTAVAIPVATTSFSFTVPIINDEIVEDCSSFCLELNNISQPSSFIRTDSAFALPFTSTVSILDDDTVVSYTGGTAVEPDDYTTINNLFEFATSTTSLSFCGLSIEDDGDFEVDEYVIVNVIDVQFPGGCMDINTVVFQGSQTVTIKSDDPEPVMTTKGIETTPGADVTTGNIGTTGLGGTTDGSPDVTTADNTNAEGTTARGTAEGTTARGTAEGTTDEGTTEEASTQTDQEIGVRKFDGEDPCAVSNPCSGENMVCSSSNGVANCTCAFGYEMQGEDYEECRDKNECLERPCTEYQDCINLDGSYECICHVGYQMIGEGYCEDINECATGQHNCLISEATVCENTMGNFTCSCIDGHVKSSSGNCIPMNLCDPIERSKCQFPEDLCFVDESGESFCACSPGFARTTMSLPCENKNECLEIPDVCKAIKYSQCVDDVPSTISPDNFYHCECVTGYVEIESGRCVKELVFRVGIVVVAVNGGEAFSLWSEDLFNKQSQKFQKTSGLLCSFLEDAVLSHPEVNMTRCLGLGFSPDGSDLNVAISLAVVPTKESFTADDVRTILVTSSQYSDTNTLLWEKENEDSISVQESSLDVKVMDDITCSVSLCKNGGTCALDTILYQTVCSWKFYIQLGKSYFTVADTSDTSVLKDDTTNLKVGLLIGLAFASLVFFLVVVGICLLLLKSQRTGKIVSGGHTEFQMTKKRPLLTQVPNIIRNPGAGGRHLRTSHKSEEVDHDEIRLQRLQQSFMRMGGSTSAEHTNQDDFEDKDDHSVSSPFTVPYETDGSINV